LAAVRPGPVRHAPAAESGRGAGPAPLREVSARLAFYVEGPRDCDLLHAWAFRLSPALADLVGEASVILGGRRPARALEHFRRLRAGCADAAALCVLDRDGDPVPRLPVESEPGLEFFTWSRRHIESYLLVPDAIRRALRLPPDDGRVERLFQRHVPAPHDEPALRELDAKRLLGEGGPFARALGAAPAPGRIARAMVFREIHPEIHALLGRLRELAAASLAPLGAPAL
jgi:hypothetical protein